MNNFDTIGTRVSQLFELEENYENKTLWDWCKCPESLLAYCALKGVDSSRIYAAILECIELVLLLLPEFDTGGAMHLVRRAAAGEKGLLPSVSHYNALCHLSNDSGAAQAEQAALYAIACAVSDDWELIVESSGLIAEAVYRSTGISQNEAAIKCCNIIRKCIPHDTIGV